jgi:autophagy-related protein 16
VQGERVGQLGAQLIIYGQSSTAIRRAYIVSVEAQLKTARDELSTLYKTQSQNAQRLISLNEQMREKDDRERDAGEETRRLNEEMVKVKRKESDLKSVVGEKDKMIQVRLV